METVTTRKAKAICTMNKLLYWLFGQLSPQNNKTTWLSRKFAGWVCANDNRKLRNHKNYLKKDHVFFNVLGAGEICISEDPHHMTGDVIGFAFGVSWGRYQLSGGVLGRAEAKRLAEFIFTKCADITETEYEEFARLEPHYFEEYIKPKIMP